MEIHIPEAALPLPRLSTNDSTAPDWRDVATIAADIVFETDLAGRFTFVGPEAPLGWSAEHLLGQSSEALLAGFAGSAVSNPFRPLAPVRQRRGSVKRADGSTAVLSISASPILDTNGQVVGARGLGVDLTANEKPAEALTGALRRWAVLDEVLRHMRAEMLAPRMMQATLERLVNATGATGALVMDAQLLADASGRAAVLHEYGPLNAAVTAAAHTTLSNTQPNAVQVDTATGERLMVCPSTTRFTGSCGLVLWRTANERPWDSDDLALIGTASSIIRVVLEHEAIQNEMAQQARIDPLTGLPNRRAFLDEAFRRVDRLDRESLPATLMFIDLDGFKRLNDRLGHDVGDAALLDTTDLLRQTFRPTDIIARFGGDEFAVWLDGADAFSSAERAEALCRLAPQELNYLAGMGSPVDSAPLRLSIGITTRWPNGEEDLEALIRQADHALSVAKRTGGGGWKVYQAVSAAMGKTSL